MPPPLVALMQLPGARKREVPAGKPQNGAGAMRTGPASVPAPIAIRRRRSAPVVPASGGRPQPASAGRRPVLRRPRRLWTASTQVTFALVCWVGLGVLVYAFSPDEAAARGAFFATLMGALFFTLTPIIHTVSLQFAHSRLYQQAVAVHAARQALMVSAFIVLNAFLQMQRAWNPLTALLLFSVFAIIEIVALARR